MRHRLLSLAPVMLAAWLCLGHGGPAEAARFIDVRIERDGGVVLETGFGASDYEPAARIWARLDRAPLRAVHEVPADAANPQQATLVGDIRITILHVDTVLASAQVDKLRLTRVSGTSDQWQLPKDEVERTGQTAGLRALTVRPNWAFIAGLVVCAFFGILAWLFVRRRRQAQDA